LWGEKIENRRKRKEERGKKKEERLLGSSPEVSGSE
jgi:hypothetical protein